MNELELNATAEGILTFIASKVDSPREILAILGMATCMLYDKCADPAVMPFNKFAGDFHISLLETHKDKTHTGPTTKQ